MFPIPTICGYYYTPVTASAGNIDGELGVRGRESGAWSRESEAGCWESGVGN